MIKIEEKELNNIRIDIIKYLKKEYKGNIKLIDIINLALYTYQSEIHKHNNNSNITK